jgi:hypothetical protein
MTDLTDEAKAEIAAAVKIVASDKGYQHVKAIKDHLMPPTPETDPPKPGDPTPPPAKPGDPPGDPEPPKKRGLWNVGNSDE